MASPKPRLQCLISSSLLSAHDRNFDRWLPPFVVHANAQFAIQGAHGNPRITSSSEGAVAHCLPHSIWHSLEVVDGSPSIRQGTHSSICSYQPILFSSNILEPKGDIFIGNLWAIDELKTLSKKLDPCSTMYQPKDRSTHIHYLLRETHVWSTALILSMA